MVRAGQILKEKRLEKKLSLEDVSKGTKIKARFLESIEKGDYDALPSSSYAHGFVRNYAQFLGIPAREILPIFRREFDTDKASPVLPKSLSKKEDFPIRRMRFGRTLAAILGLFIIVIAYIVFQYRYAFINPPLTVVSPQESVSLVAQEIVVSGKTDPNATIVVNNSATSVDQNGNFKKTIDVFSGSETIVVKAVSRFGKETEIDRHITVKTQ